MRVLLTADFDPAYQARLCAKWDTTVAGYAVNPDFESLLSEDELIAALEDVDVHIVSYERITQRVIDACPRLSLIASIRGGPEDNVDVAAALAAGLPILRTVGRTQRPVTEHTMLLLLALARSLGPSTGIIADRQWNPETMAEAAGVDRMNALYDTITELHGKTLGLVGIGNIGAAVSRIAQAFGMTVIAHDPYADPGRAREAGIGLVDLPALLAGADYVSLHARLSPETKRFIGREQFRAMKPTACFVNTARAALVDTEALAEALRERRIRAAAIDVFDEEPPPRDHPLLAVPADRLILTPHTAGFSLERVPYHSKYVLDGIDAYLAGMVPEGLFDRAVLASPRFAARGGRLFARSEA